MRRESRLGRGTRNRFYVGELTVSVVLRARMKLAASGVFLVSSRDFAPALQPLDPAKSLERHRKTITRLDAVGMDKR
jgi:hypothetical protein